MSGNACCMTLYGRLQGALPIQLYAAHNAVHFVPYANGILNLSETSVTDQHWSVRKQKAGVQE